MNGKYQPGQKVFLTGGNKNLIKEATVLKYTGGFYTIRFENGGGIKVRESRIYPTRKEAEAAILNRARNRSLSCRVILAGAADMFYEELKQIIESVLQQGLSGQPLMEVLTANVNPAEIYASDDMLVTDSFFSLLHFATGEEMLTDAEWKYLLDCLNGNRIYSLDEKLKMTDKNSSGGLV